MGIREYGNPFIKIIKIEFMNYKNWNQRSFGGFIEECLYSGEDEYCSDLSIIEFKDSSRYSSEERSKLYQYLSEGFGIVASTDRRKNAYNQSIEASYALFTDGEVVYDNLIIQYILYADFVLPEKWFILIKERGFVMPKFEFDDFAFFNYESTEYETFDRESYLKKFIRYL
jgi:hypothetical protein